MAVGRTKRHTCGCWPIIALEETHVRLKRQSGVNISWREGERPQILASATLSVARVEEGDC